jgi:multiple sugar transport system substrate-binding protein
MKKIVSFMIFLLLLSINAQENLSDKKSPYSKNSISKKNYKGITLNVLTHVPPNIGEPITIHAREFEKLTHIKINIKYVPWSQIYPEVIYGLQSGAYDIVTPCSDIIPDTAKFLAPLPQKMLNSKQWKDIMDYHKMIATYNGVVVQMTIDGDRHALHYRHDILTNPQIKKEYLAKFGKELEVPKTWKELNQIAKFINGRLIAGKKIYGIVEITKKDDLLYSNFIKRAPGYAKHPDVKGGFFFDLKTMEPLINTPGWVEALKDFVAAQDYYPPGGKNFGLVDVNAAFGKGLAVFTDNWDDSFISAMEKSSPCRNNVRVALSPGSKKVWNRDKKRWDYFKVANQVPFISMGWISGVAANSKHKEAAFDFLGYASNYKNHRIDMCIGRFGINPFRKSDLDVDFWVKKAGWKPKVAHSFVNSLRLQMNSKSRVFDLRIPGCGQYMKQLQIAVARALAKQSTPKEALDYAAEQWKKITERYGVDEQREKYKPIVEMEDYSK